MRRKTLPLLIAFLTLLIIPTSGLASHADRFVDAIETYVEGDYAAALRQLNALAEEGDVRAHCWLGFMYQKGEGVQKNFAEAAKWYRKAADFGCSKAAHKLSRMYEKGEGVKMDLAEAAKWCRKAAEQGNASAQEDFGDMCARGIGVPRDYIKAYMWLDLAARRYPVPDIAEKAAKKRDVIALKMSPDELVEAQRQVRQWRPMQ